MDRWKTIAITTLGVVILNVSAFPQTSTQPAPGTPPAKTPAVTQPEPAAKSKTTDPAKPMAKDSTMTSERVRAVQEALKGKGHDPGPIDGIFGPKTEAALKNFQKAEKLQESGRADAQTLAKLGVQ